MKQEPCQGSLNRREGGGHGSHPSTRMLLSIIRFASADILPPRSDTGPPAMAWSLDRKLPGPSDVPSTAGEESTDAAHLSPPWVCKSGKGGKTLDGVAGVSSLEGFGGCLSAKHGGHVCGLHAWCACKLVCVSLSGLEFRVIRVRLMGAHSKCAPLCTEASLLPTTDPSDRDLSKPIPPELGGTEGILSEGVISGDFHPGGRCDAAPTLLFREDECAPAVAGRLGREEVGKRRAGFPGGSPAVQERGTGGGRGKGRYSG